jgi:hypothetical protein
LSVNLKARDVLAYLGADGRKILKRVVNKEFVGLWSNEERVQ